MTQFIIHERLFYQSLAVVKHTINLNGCDVLAQCGKLAFLYFAYLTFGVEHIHVYAVNAQKAIGYGRSCVATGSNEHIYLFVTLLTNKVLQQAGHEACAYIFKGEGRAVEQFQTVDVRLNLYQGAVEGQRVIYNLFEVVGSHIFSEEGLSHLISYLLKR